MPSSGGRIDDDDTGSSRPKDGPRLRCAHDSAVAFCRLLIAIRIWTVIVCWRQFTLPRRLLLGMAAFLLLYLEDVVDWWFQDLLQSNETAGRAAAGFLVLVVQPAPVLQPQTESMEPVQRQRPTYDNQTPEQKISSVHTRLAKSCHKCLVGHWTVRGGNSPSPVAAEH
jgi:hypothetical protein